MLDALLYFRLYPVALTADVSKMYQAIELTDNDKDLHMFMWRSHPNDRLKDYRMTRVTFRCMVAPTKSVSLRETPVEDLSFVVVLDSLYTACMGGQKVSSGGFFRSGMGMVSACFKSRYSCMTVEFLETTLLVQRMLQRHWLA